MENFKLSQNTTFYALGLSYKKADALIRGKFSLDAEGQSDLLAQAKTEGIESLIVISTCNRTEIYGWASHPYELIKLLCGHTKGSVEEFQQFGYIYKNSQAVSHMFRVGTGLESQILGDFEIISQIRTAFSRSREKGLADTFLDRLVNTVIQASKKVKTETKISCGAASVSFASVQYIIQNAADAGNKNILLLGTGKIGGNTCVNLLKHTKNSHITLINRTRHKAELLARRLNVIVKDYGDLKEELQKADVLVVATGAQSPTIDKTFLGLDKPLLILDLSIPRNVDADVKEIPGVTLMHLDDLSQIADQTLERRKQHIPAAEAIIEDLKSELYAWVNGRKCAPTIHALKAKLNEIVSAEFAFQKKKAIHFDEVQMDLVSSRIIQKLIGHFASHLKDENTPVDQSIEFIEKVFQIGRFMPDRSSSPREEKYRINLS